ncbi:hypothetical protein LMG23992_01400 [Cupriavidus laharis]|uniref:Thiamine pyrophosphate enzyme N-terminal TPP-binding domain-containing protein n=1 Tax=Cupriavidus laharis TaxID=151654 RepID=A0ABM8WNY2_9BURK|nr:thiamine pyrophosphate-binding protein [Cupriavidus laharis]CAG9169126.1 hypothetical protein LMG23992_01400 [Cupriavidus laharis]
MPEEQQIGASACIEALQAAGITHFVTVPDYVQLALHTAVEDGNSRMTLVRCCNEDQAVCTAAGLAIAGKRPVVVVQNQGLYACVNSLRAVTMDAQIPLLLMIGQFGRETANFGQPTRLSRRRVVNLLEPLLDALDVPCWQIDSAADAGAIATASDAAVARRGAAALTIGRPLGWH